MRQDRRRWLAPLLAALLLITGSVPARTFTAPGAHAAATIVHDRPAPDDAVRATAADHVERGGVTERSALGGLVPTRTAAPESITTGAARSATHVAAHLDPTPNAPRAPPGSASPIPF